MYEDEEMENDSLPSLSIYTEKQKKTIKTSEIKRLKKIFKDYPKEINDLAKQLIESCATIFVVLKETEAQILKFGSVEYYKNGANQWGKKKSASVEVHNLMIKNYALVIKQLIELLPKDRQNDALNEFTDFIKAGKGGN